jgi:hypothetical protein
MSDITVVTTFHKPGLETYGQRFLDSFAKQVDKRIKLLVYAENCNPVNPDPNQITILDAVEELPKLNAFKERWKDVPKANGIPPDDIKARRPRDWHKEFKWHAVRFANKTYAVFDACVRSKDWCVWMDADTFIHSRWHYEDFIDLLPKDTWLTYVGRGKGSQTWPECGFYGMNLNDNICKAFLKEFELYYEQAEQGIFTLDEWHDSYVFGHILNKRKGMGNVLDYSAEMYLKEARTGGGGHPLINSVLGKWMDHMKGVRKEEGRSRTKDLMVNRTEGYWTN